MLIRKLVMINLNGETYYVIKLEEGELRDQPCIKRCKANVPLGPTYLQVTESRGRYTNEKVNSINRRA